MIFEILGYVSLIMYLLSIPIALWGVWLVLSKKFHQPILKTVLIAMYILLVWHYIYEGELWGKADLPGHNGGEGLFGIWWIEVFALQVAIIAALQLAIFLKYKKIGKK
jgi:hypothetical protein